MKHASSFKYACSNAASAACRIRSRHRIVRCMPHQAAENRAQVNFKASIFFPNLETSAQTLSEEGWNPCFCVLWTCRSSSCASLRIVTACQKQDWLAGICQGCRPVTVDVDEKPVRSRVEDLRSGFNGADKAISKEQCGSTHAALHLQHFIHTVFSIYPSMSLQAHGPPPFLLERGRDSRMAAHSPKFTGIPRNINFSGMF